MTRKEIQPIAPSPVHSSKTSILRSPSQSRIQGTVGENNQWVARMHAQVPDNRPHIDGEASHHCCCFSQNDSRPCDAEPPITQGMPTATCPSAAPPPYKTPTPTTRPPPPRPPAEDPCAPC